MLFGDNKVSIVITCHRCNEDQSPLVMTHAQLKAWIHGDKIQRAMPHLNPAERELLISGTCDDCFNEMFSEDG